MTIVIHLCDRSTTQIRLLRALVQNQCLTLYLKRTKVKALIVFRQSFMWLYQHGTTNNYDGLNHELSENFRTRRGFWEVEHQPLNNLYDVYMSTWVGAYIVTKKSGLPWARHGLRSVTHVGWGSSNAEGGETWTWGWPLRWYSIVEVHSEGCSTRWLQHPQVSKSTVNFG